MGTVIGIAAVVGALLVVTGVLVVSLCRSSYEADEKGGRQEWQQQKGDPRR